MLSNEPGWYPDPEGGRQVRFWDGTEWTEYVQPFAPVLTALHGVGTAVSDYPYLSDADIRPTNEPRIVSTWTTEAVAPVVGLAPPRRRRSPLVWWVAGAAVVLVGITVGVVTALRTDTPVLTDPTPSSTTVADRTATLGAPVTIDVPAQGDAVVTIEVPEDGAYFLESTSPSGDLVATLRQDDQDVWRSDDRGNELAELIGGTWSDPGSFVQLTAGTYELTVDEHQGAAATATVSLYASDVVDVAAGQPLDVTIPQDGYVVLRLALDAETPLTVDVRGHGDWDDPRLIWFQDSRAQLSDDRGAQLASDLGGTEYDPFLETTLPAGTSFLVLEEYSRAGIDVTVTVAPR